MTAATAYSIRRQTDVSNKPSATSSASSPPDEIRQGREARFLTPADLVANVGVEPAAVAAWELGYRLQSREVDRLMRRVYRGA